MINQVLTRNKQQAIHISNLLMLAVGITTFSLCLAPSAKAESVDEITLGGDEKLVAGIPGDGPLTLEQVRNWLNEASNHVELKPVLPIGLDAGAGQIQGLKENPLTRAKIELGRQLFFDTRLSADDSISCASCHDPDFGYAADTQFGIGIDGQEGDRNSPVAYNRLLSAKQFWDGRAATLEDQAIGPIENPIEMGNTHDACVETITAIPAYRLQFERVFDEEVTIENIGKAIASFERVLVTGPSAWDHHERLAKFEESYADDLADPEYLAEEEPELLAERQQLKAAAAASPLSESARLGGELFFSERSGCSQCHVGANFADELYHNLGVGFDTIADGKEPDWGRFNVTGNDQDRGAFKTPTLRNIADTAPYMHDGSQDTLAEVIAWYVKGGHPNPHLSDKVKKLDLTDQEQAQLVAFMKALSGKLPRVETERLPE